MPAVLASAIFHLRIRRRSPEPAGTDLLTRRPPVALAIGAFVLLVGTGAAIYYSYTGLALSHYDARAHLVVSRRIFDSLVPGWQQIGAVWLPLPHLLNMIPVQIDLFYRTGASAIALSVLSMAGAAWALARLILRTTGSAAGGVTAAALLLANPNLLYLQSTPMTEPLLFATTMLAVMLTAEWAEAGAFERPRAAGVALAAACLTRYEAWPVAAALVGLGGLSMLRRGQEPRAAALACMELSVYPAIAVLLFLVNSRWTTGHWFLTSGFFVAENEAQGQGWMALGQVGAGMYDLSGWTLVWPAYASAALVLVAFVRSARFATLATVLALTATAALPWYAYVNGHPLRVRYSLPLVFAACALCGVGVSLLPRRLRAVAGVLLVLSVLWRQPPLDAHAPMLREAQLDDPNRAGRAAVTEYLVTHHDGGAIMMSMGSLAHYMHDLSAHDFDIKNFLHEGNGDLWVFALERGPRGFTKWVVVEEQAEGGDAVAQRARAFPEFYRDFARVAEGGGIALYRSEGIIGVQGS